MFKSSTSIPGGENLNPLILSYVKKQEVPSNISWGDALKAQMNLYLASEDILNLLLTKLGERTQR